MKIFGLFLVIYIGFSTMLCAKEVQKIRAAVEFVTHAAPAYIAKEKGWFEEEELNVETFNSYVNGVALAAALSQGEADVAYICLTPAINAYVNAKVGLKVVSGMHLYGYRLMVNPEKVKTLKDLENPAIRIGTVKEGAASDALLNLTVEKFNLNLSIIEKTRRMAPPMLYLALKNGQLDAVFMPEQYPSMAEQLGFKELVDARDVWKNMPGSVLIVTQKLFDESPEIVEKLVKINRRAIHFIEQNREESVRIVNDALSATGKKLYPDFFRKAKSQDSTQALLTNEASIEKSLYEKLYFTAEIDAQEVQKAIDNAYRWGYIKQKPLAQEILGLKYNHD